MSLRVRELLIRIETSRGPYGTRLTFEDGLCILRAPNTSGKSTCLEAIVYALGLEGMISASQEVPLRRAVTDAIRTDYGELPVLESSIYLEIENSTNQRLTVNRTVKGTRDRRLIRVWAGPALSKPNGAYSSSDYLVRVRGGASGEVGFHALLTDFLGWTLPVVPRYDGSESILYLECIFPLFAVEQKKGWSVLPARIPQYLKIQEVAKRSIEFLLNLDAYRNAERRREIQARVQEIKVQWSALYERIQTTAKDVNGAVQDLPGQPVMSWPPQIPPRFSIARNESWVSASEAIERDQVRLHDLETEGIPKLQQVTVDVEEKLSAAQEQLAQKDFALRQLYETLQTETAQVASTEERIEALEEDLRRYQDLQRLQEFGSADSLDLGHGRCPTCHQAVSDTLLTPGSGQQPMTVAENIVFIKAQIDVFRTMHRNSRNIVSAYQQSIKAAQAEANNLRERIRTLRQSLVSDGRLPSLEAVEERLRLQRQVRNLKAATDSIEENLSDFSDLAFTWRAVQEELRLLPSGDLSPSDEKKLQELKGSFVDQLQKYGLTSVLPSSVEISRDSYKPIRDGFDMDFNNSDSDLIRTHWAYVNSFLEIARTTSTNHPGLMVLDEPGQQNIAWSSLRDFLLRLSVAKQYSQQVIVSSSNDPELLKVALQDVPYQYIPFDGPILRPL